MQNNNKDQLQIEQDKSVQNDKSVNERALFVRKYSDDEITAIYELARLSFETGNLKRAELIGSGLTVIAPDFIPSFILLAIINAFNSNYDKVVEMTQQILKRDANNLEAQLLVASVYINTGNYTMAGTILGEISERIRKGVELNPILKRFFDLQLARFEAR